MGGEPTWSISKITRGESSPIGRRVPTCSTHPMDNTPMPSHALSNITPKPQIPWLMPRCSQGRTTASTKLYSGISAVYTVYHLVPWCFIAQSLRLVSNMERIFGIWLVGCSLDGDTEPLFLTDKETRFRFHMWGRPTHWPPPSTKPVYREQQKELSPRTERRHSYSKNGEL